MTHVTPETARRLEDAGFPQPEKSGGSLWYDTSDFLIVLSTGASGAHPGQILAMSPGDGITFVTVQSEMTDWAFAPSATDIMQHLPGWYLTFSNGEFVCLSFDGEGNAPHTFNHKSPAEAAAKAWFFEQSHAKK